MNRYFASSFITLTFVLLMIAAGAISLAQEDSTAGFETPRQALQQFIDSGRAGDWEAAAQAMDTRSVPAGENARWARRLKFALDQNIWIVWEEIPDVAYDPDAHNGPGRTVEVGRIDVPRGSIPFTLRWTADSGWLISRETVAATPELFEVYGVGALDSILPEWSYSYRFAEVLLWQWMGLLAAAIVAFAAGFGVRWGIIIAVASRMKDEDARQRVRNDTPLPLTLFITGWLFLAMSHAFLGLAGPARDRLDLIVGIFLTITGAWLADRVSRLILAIARDRMARKVAGGDSIKERSFHTQVLVLQRVITFAIVILGAGVSLAQVETFRALGASLLASAGVAGLILGLAAQRTLGNLFAGIQIALAQPLRVGDSVIVENEWGWVEDITMTFVTVRVWDLRRLVIPTTWFLDRPFQNWTITEPQLIGTVFLHADFRVNVQEMREELARLLEGSKLWNRKVPAVLVVTDMKPGVVELRALCSANSAGEAWDLRCHIRENLLLWLQNHEGGRYLPRTRVAVRDDEPSAAAFIPAAPDLRQPE